MFRTFVLARHTFAEAVAQPIYLLVLVVGAAILGVLALLPFFTLGEDVQMFMDVGRDIIVLLVLLATLFATSATIYNEIEDRTMLTLMSKPVARWQVIVGKFLGLAASAGVAVLVLGGVLLLLTLWRLPGDYAISTTSIDDRDVSRIADLRLMHGVGLVASLVTAWLQIAVLAAVGIAISTRASLVVNLPAVLFVYFAGNLSRFIDAAAAEGSLLTRTVAWIANAFVPFLGMFDLRDRTLFGTIAVPGTNFVNDTAAASLGGIAADVSLAALYAALYAAAILGIGLLLFRSRELGGAAG
jgi:ABC-type transport system involved in multi-copper enzyme maturation permease subunit